MKRKFLKFFAIVIGLLVIGIAALLIYVKVALPNVGPAPDIHVTSTPETIKRGKYLASHVMVCLDCHGARDWTKFSGPMKPGFEGGGGELFDQRFGFPGTFYAKNITPFNLGSWTDGEIFRTITTGVNRDGKALFPVMPYKYYAQLDEEDIKAVIAYIRTLPSIESKIPASKTDFPMNFILNTIPGKANLQKRPPPSDVIAYGKYLVTASACIECHTNQVRGKVVGEQFAGGREFNIGNGNIVRSMNITPDASGIGNWTKEEFIQRFKMYTDSTYVLPTVDLAKGNLQSIMPWTMYAGMTTDDLGAIYEYLRTIPRVNSKVVRYTVAKK
jgi:mono/diheme cytochrome c family protein